MTIERKLIAAAVSSALALPMAAQAVEFSVSGHVNRAILSVDTGGDDDDDLEHVDSNASQSRVRFTGSEELDNGMTAGVNLEMGILSTGATSGTTTRHAAAYLGTPGGKLTLGHTSVATDGMAHARLGGPSWLGGVTNWCSFYDKNAAGGDAVACPSNDGGRTDVLRYDTPSLGPATLSFSAGDNDYWDAMLKIAGSFGDAGYDIRIGHIAEYETSETKTPPRVARTTTTGDARDRATRQFTGGQLWNWAHDGDIATAPPAGAGAPEVTAALAERLRMPEYAGSELTSWDDAERKGDDDFQSHGTGQDTAVTNARFYTLTTPARAASTSTTLVQPPDVTTKSKQGDITTASAAVAFGQGTSIAVAWSQDTNPGTNTDHEYTYVEADHSYGDGSVGVYWKQGERGNGPGSSTEGSLWGVGIGHNIGAGATAYAGYRVIKEDGISDNVSIILAGMRVTFN